MKSEFISLQQCAVQTGIKQKRERESTGGSEERPVINPKFRSCYFEHVLLLKRASAVCCWEIYLRKQREDVMIDWVM